MTKKPNPDKTPHRQKSVREKSAAKSAAFVSRVGLIASLRTFYLEVPAEIVKKLGGSFKLRLHVTVEGAKAGAKLRSHEYRTGLTALGQGRAYVPIKKKILNDLGLSEDDRPRLRLKADESRYGMEMPKELAELFRQDPPSRKRFDVLTPGMQRYILYYVNGVKNPDKRLERAMLLIGNLMNAPAGKVTFRQLLKR